MSICGGDERRSRQKSTSTKVLNPKCIQIGVREPCVGTSSMFRSRACFGEAPPKFRPRFDRRLKNPLSNVVRAVPILLPTWSFLCYTEARDGVHLVLPGSNRSPANKAVIRA